jgi:hypothetical protein
MSTSEAPSTPPRNAAAFAAALMPVLALNFIAFLRIRRYRCRSNVAPARPTGSQGYCVPMRKMGDRRQVNVELTGKGSALYPRVTEIVADVNRQFLDGFSPSEADQLQYLLQRLFANRKSPSDADRRTCHSKYSVAGLKSSRDKVGQTGLIDPPLVYSTVPRSENHVIIFYLGNIFLSFHTSVSLRRFVLLKS